MLRPIKGIDLKKKAKSKTPIYVKCFPGALNGLYAQL